MNLVSRIYWLLQCNASLIGVWLIVFSSANSIHSLGCDTLVRRRMQFAFLGYGLVQYTRISFR